MATSKDGVFPAPLDVDELLEKHSSSIASLRDAVKDVLTDESQDEIYLLRYLLSFDKDVSKCAEQIRKAAAWRASKADLLGRAKSGEPLEYDDVIRKYAVSGVYRTTVAGGPLTIVRAGLSNPVAITDVLSYEQTVDWFMYEKELIHMACDAATRKSRKLVKTVSIIDLKNYPLMGGKDKQFQKATGEATKLSAFLYPQLLQCTVMINVPTVFKVVFPIIKRFFSKKTIDKLRVCPANTTEDAPATTPGGGGGGTGDAAAAAASTCPFAAHLVAIQDLPTFLGGGCLEPLAGVPNDQTRPNQILDEQGMARITVPRKDKYEVFEDIAKLGPAGALVTWTVVVEAKGIEMSAVLKVPPKTGNTQAAAPPKKPAGPASAAAQENDDDDASLATTTATTEDSSLSSITVMQVDKLKSAGKDAEMTGTFVVPTKGLLVVTFDNSYSILNSKTLRYKLQIEPKLN